MKKYSISLYLLAIVFTFSLVSQSCKDEKITGCTDATAVNYNPDANEAGDCVYHRDKFLGNYLGDFTCNFALSLLNSDSLNFSITETTTGNETIKLNLTLSTGPLSLEGNVVNDTLKVSQRLTNIEVTGLGFSDIDASAVATMDATEKILSGKINIKVYPTGSTTLLVGDNCNISGVKL